MRDPEPNSDLNRDFEPLRVAFAIGALLLGLATGVRAEEPGYGSLMLIEADGDQRPALRLETETQFNISGLVAEVSVRQSFRNDGNDWVEGRYLLPLPEGAAVHDMKLVIGKRVIVGEIREKAQAQAEYAAAKQAGQKTSLVEQSRANLFRTAVANIAPGETISVELGYWQKVDFKDGVFSVSFPLTLTPRYAGSNGQEAATNTAVPATPMANAANAPKVAIKVALDPGLPLTRIESPSHTISTLKTGTRYEIALSDRQVPADRDFVLTWVPDALAKPAVALFTEQVGDENYALLMMVAPEQAASVLPRELILVIDTSGSMFGASMEQAKAALDLGLSKLRPVDRFNVIQFNSVTEAMLDSAVAATAENVQLARDWVSLLKADGGTEMYPALELAPQGQAPQGYVRQIVFATDGSVSNEEGLLTLIETKLGESRLFPVGIGSAPNGYFLTKAAQVGRGADSVIRDLSEVSDKMQTLFNKLDRPALRDLQLAWPGLAEVYPERLPDLYQGEPLLVVARLPRLEGQVEALGWLAGGDWSKSVPLSRHGTAAGLGRLWARQKIDGLEDALRRGAQEPEVRSAILEVALKHHLISRYTSLVAVDKTPARPADAPLTSTQLANGIPAGSVGYAATATSAPQKLLIGLLALLMALAIKPKRTARRVVESA